MISVTAEVNSKPNKEGHYSVFIRIYQKGTGQKKRIQSSVAIRRLSDWNKDKHRIRASEPNAQIWNEALDTECGKIMSIYRNLESKGGATLEKIAKIASDKDPKDTLLSYARSQQMLLQTAGQLGTFQKYGTFINKMEGYLAGSKQKDTSFKNVDLDFVEGFKAYLQKQTNSRTKGKLHDNTIAKIEKTFRAIVNKAENAGYIAEADNPFRNKKHPIAECSSHREALSAEDLLSVASLQLEEGSAKWHARNAFFFSYYCAGIRAGDFFQLRWRNVQEGRLVYTMSKNGKEQDIKLPDPAAAILDFYRKEGQKQSDYIFPYLNSKAAYAKEIVLPVKLKQELFADIHRKNVQINRRLKEILEAAGIKKEISFHISRHTFARQAKAARIDNLTIQRLLQHSSLNVTEKYMNSFDVDEKDKALQQIFHPTGNTKEDLLLETLHSLDKSELESILSKLNKDGKA